MKIHEYQAREILKRHGVPYLESTVITKPDEARTFAEKLGCPVVIKAQVLVGGRGKAGGIKLAGSSVEAVTKATKILGMKIKKLPVKTALVARAYPDDATNIKQEYYAGILNDRKSRKPLMMVSPRGGVDIEKVARRTPNKILEVVIDPTVGLQQFQLRKMSAFLTKNREVAKQVERILLSLYEAFFENDASLAEINPIALFVNGSVYGLDAKINIDDNALYRQKKIDALRDTSTEDAGEIEARRYDISYVPLEKGTIGCIVNGAGLAMATMDMIKKYGAMPANFLDIGGSSSPEKVLSALRIILRDTNVRSILVNIFGGITRCDDVATGIIEAKDKLGLDVPLVVRLTGTNEELAREMLAGTDLIPAATMKEGVRKAVQVARRAQRRKVR